MGSVVSENHHLVCIPFPAQGHVNPFMQMARLLNLRGFFITIVYTEFNHSRLLRSKGPDAVKNSPGFLFETIPDGVPPSNPDANQRVTELLYYTQKHSVAPLRELIKKLNSTEVARELGIPEVQFSIASTCGLLAYLQFGNLVQRRTFPLKDESLLTNGHMKIPLEWILGMKNMRLKDMPSFVRSRDPEDIAFNRWLEEARDCLTSDAIVFNTFHDFESEVLEAVSTMFPNIFNIGPLSLLLDEQEPSSVVYINVGSIAVMTEAHLKEFAWGLVNSGHPFLWILRSDVVMGSYVVLSPEFLEETKDDSELGPIREGSKPPFDRSVSDSQRLELDAGRDLGRSSDDMLAVFRGAASELQEMLEEESGKEMRKKSVEWKKKAEAAAVEGGSSFRDFERFVLELQTLSSHGRLVTQALRHGNCETVVE
ncbi:hypothetical protein FNV43_RR26127 [Rhamnella rubrinervis]|uniref:Uncharacterized protein n=1 Tax=Rhamnella rubrinervis TaxID=2594499 RepID=A0A8K0GNH2_9ROSA|nr:hypothetical protein FNV43_RR26127 [Rhamnella rubrinervis]